MVFRCFWDNRNFEAAYRNVLEDINSGGPADPGFPRPDFAVGVGDIDPVKRTLEIFRRTMGPEMPFIPVRGNHESFEDVRFILKEILPSEQPPVTLYDNASTTFYYDWKNIRLIVIDQYVPYAKNLDDRKFLRWLEKAVISTKDADHVFITFHEPRFPADTRSDPFWNMLLRHSDKVRAVLWGHTHVYGRRSLPRFARRNRTDQLRGSRQHRPLRRYEYLRSNRHRRQRRLLPRRPGPRQDQEFQGNG